jgi:Tol biopolymer transport system component
MNLRVTSILLLVALSFVSMRGFAPPTRAAEEKPPQPEMIGEGVISTPDDEFGGSFSPDGQTIYFDKTVSPHYLYTLCASHLSGGKWSAPEVLSFSGEYRDSDPVLSPDGQTLFFASDRPVHGKPVKAFFIWASKKSAAGWSEPQVLEGSVNSEGSQVFASVANNGNLYFTSDRKGEFDIYRSRLVDGKYQEAEDLGPTINSVTISSLEAFIAADESYLLIGSFGRQPGYGDSDIFISYNQNGSWTTPKNLGPVINTAAREYSPRVTAEGKWLIFTSERGMQTEKRTEPFTYEEFTQKSRSIRNGLGNIYRIPMDYVLSTTRP